MINYFYNIALKADNCDFYSDVLTSIRKDFYLSKAKQKGKITQDSNGDSIFYEFSLEKDKNLKWMVSDSDSIISDSKSAEDNKYCVNYYSESGLCKRITFSKFHTLLMVEYFELTRSQQPYRVIEPRKSDDGLCLLITSPISYQSDALFAMPKVDDEYIQDIVDDEFTDYSVVASTNDGVVKFLNNDQLELFKEFVRTAEERKASDTAPKRFIDEDDAVLAQKFNPKDFNLKRNLSEVLNIADAKEFNCDIEDIIETDVYDEDVSNEDIDLESPADDVIEPEVLTTDAQKPEFKEVESFNDTQMVVDDTDLLVEKVVISETEEDRVVEELAVDTTVDEIVEPVVIEEVSIDTAESGAFDEITENETLQDTEDVVLSEEFEVSKLEDADSVIENSSSKYYYYGELDANSNRCGYGRTATENGHTAYEGQYLDNKRDGIGSYYYKDGKLCYYGEWKNNKREGVGVGISSFDNSIHVGTFENNKPVGDGARIAKDGKVDFITKTLSSGITVKMQFVNDTIIITKYNENGDIISENSSNLNMF